MRKKCMPIRDHQWHVPTDGHTDGRRLHASLAATPQNEAPAQLSVQVNVVTVPVTVTDAHGEFVRGLQQQNFRLSVDGAERPIEYFAAEEEPARCSCWWRRDRPCFCSEREHLSAVAALIDGLGPTDRIAVASYSDAPRLLLDFTTDKRQAAAALGSLGYGLGIAQLNFYDSLGFGCGLDGIERNEMRDRGADDGARQLRERALGSPGREIPKE